MKVILERDIAKVDVFIFATGPIVFYTTPDLKRIGDNEIGLYRITPGQNFDVKSTNNTLTSLCFPKSNHFSIDCKTVNTVRKQKLLFFYYFIFQQHFFIVLGKLSSNQPAPNICQQQ